MSPKYRLIYFDAYGAAESIRQIFAYVNQDYEDIRVKRENWPAIKPTTPFGKVPVLEIEGKPITQSSAISRYLAKQFGLAGKDDWESLQCDVLVDTLKDFQGEFRKMFLETNAEKKEELKKEIFEKHIPFYLGKFDKIVADNSSGLLVGSQVTWADITFASTLDIFQTSKPDILKPYPNLERLLKKIQSNPGVKAWYEKRPPDTMTAIL